MSHVDSATVTHERSTGRVHIRMEIDERAYIGFRTALAIGRGDRFLKLLTDGDRDKSDQSEVFGRYDDVPKVGD